VKQAGSAASASPRGIGDAAIEVMLDVAQTRALNAPQLRIVLHFTIVDSFPLVVAMR
jgi:hypothetical protein